MVKNGIIEQTTIQGENMRSITVYNPAAGKGKPVSESEGAYFTTAPGDCRRFIAEECKKDPNTHFTVCGGDGTLNEAVCGIMDADCGQKALLTAVACGSGNDTVKTLPTEKGIEQTLDVMKYDAGYSINMINSGFDCNVVASHNKIKKKFRLAGKLSYILGVIIEFFKPFGEDFTINAITEDGNEFSYYGSCLLCCICNGQWCGGSFHNSPLSDMADGVLELIVVRKMKRLKFLKLVGKYKDGTLFDPITRDISVDEDKKYVTFLRVRSVSVKGMKQFCADGEITQNNQLDVCVIPGALKYKT